MSDMDWNKHMLDKIDAQAVEIAKLKTVMIAAAEEISAHWDAHCDADGYGPANLMRRLEDGIPSQYGYTAGAFAKQAAEIEALRADAEELAFLEQDLLYWVERAVSKGNANCDTEEAFGRYETWLTDRRAAIDAALAGKAVTP